MNMLKKLILQNAAVLAILASQGTALADDTVRLMQRQLPPAAEAVLKDPVNLGALNDRMERLADFRAEVLSGKRSVEFSYLKLLTPQAISELDGIRRDLMSKGLSGHEADLAITRRTQELLTIDAENLKKLSAHYEGQLEGNRKLIEGVRNEQSGSNNLNQIKDSGKIVQLDKARIAAIQESLGQTKGSLYAIEVAQKELIKDSAKLEKTIKSHWRSFPKEQRNIFYRSGALVFEWASLSLKAPFAIGKTAFKATFETLKFGGKVAMLPLRGGYHAGKFVATRPLTVTAATVAVAAFAIGSYVAHSELDKAAIGAVVEALDETKLATLTVYYDLLGQESAALEAKVEREIYSDDSVLDEVGEKAQDHGRQDS